MKNISLFVLSNLICLCVLAQSNEIPANGLAYYNGNFHNIKFTRHSIGENDVQIDILYSGICHSDFGTLRVSKEESPVVPGHEMIGRISKIGKNVKKFKVGDLAGVGCMVNSCGKCENCKKDKQQFCLNGTAFTYGGNDPYHGNRIGMGGYANLIVVSENFAMTIPKNTDIKRAAPLLCAGATTWSAIKYAKVKKGDKVGVAGFGGLGHVAVKYLVDLGAKVTVFDITEDKRADAKRLGAVEYVNMKDSTQKNYLKNKFDFIISTIPSDYDPSIYISMLKMETGELALIGLPLNSTINVFSMIIPNAHRKVFGSLIAGTKETQEMLNYSIEHNIYPEVEEINAIPSEIDKAYKNIDEGKVKFRYVINMKNLNKN